MKNKKYSRSEELILEYTNRDRSAEKLKEAFLEKYYAEHIAAHKRQFQEPLIDYSNVPKINDDYLKRIFMLENSVIKFNAHAHVYFNGEVDLSVRKAKKLDKNRSLLSFLTGFRFILPKAYREEFAGDLIESYNGLKREKRCSAGIYFFLTLQVLSVIWASVRFKLSEVYERRSNTNK